MTKKEFLEEIKDIPDDAELYASGKDTGDFNFIESIEIEHNEENHHWEIYLQY